MTILSVNLNKVALVRNSRDTTSPSPVEFAGIAVAAGAEGITVHPRPDQRHIRASDCHELAEAVTVEFNIEGNPFAPPIPSGRENVSDYPGFMALVEATPAGYREHGRFQIEKAGNHKSWSHPVVVDGVFYIKNQHTLTAYDVRAK